MRYAALLHSTKEQAKKILQRLKFDNETIDTVMRLVAAHNEYLELCEDHNKNLTAMRHMIHRLGPDLMELLWELQLADSLAGNQEQIEEVLGLLSETKKLHAEVLRRGDCISLKQLAVNGKDLMELGVQPGKQIGEVLNLLLEHVLDIPELNERELLLQKAREFLS